MERLRSAPGISVVRISTGIGIFSPSCRLSPRYKPVDLVNKCLCSGLKRKLPLNLVLQCINSCLYVGIIQNDLVKAFLQVALVVIIEYFIREDLVEFIVIIGNDGSPAGKRIKAAIVNEAILYHIRPVVVQGDARFAVEFAALLNAGGHRILSSSDDECRISLAKAKSNFIKLERVIPENHVNKLIAQLEKHMYPLLKPLRASIPRRSITASAENYAEVLPKTANMKTVDLNGVRSRAVFVAKELGLLQMMHSSSFRKFAEIVSGHSLYDDLTSSWLTSTTPGWTPAAP